MVHFLTVGFFYNIFYIETFLIYFSYYNALILSSLLIIFKYANNEHTFSETFVNKVVGLKKEWPNIF